MSQIKISFYEMRLLQKEFKRACEKKMFGQLDIGEIYEIIERMCD